MPPGLAPKREQRPDLYIDSARVWFEFMKAELALSSTALRLSITKRKMGLIESAKQS